MTQQLPFPKMDVFELSNTEIAYFAGLFDGEGSIAVYTNKGDKSARFGITVGMVNPTVIEELRLAFGGSIYKQMRAGRPVYYWRTFGKRAELVLKILLPFLRVKREEAELAIAYRQYNYRQGFQQNKQRIVDKVHNLRHPKF